MIKKLPIALLMGLAVGAHGAEITPYGSLRMALQNLDTDGGATDSLDIEDRLSRIGIKASTEFAEGVTIFGQIEYGLTEGGEFTQGADQSLRLALVGFKGDFGTLTIGSQTTLFHKMVRAAYFEDGNDSLRHGAIRDDDLVQYNRKIGALSFGAEVSFEDEDDEDINHYTAAVQYATDRFKLQAAVLKDNVGANTGTMTGVRAWGYMGPLTLSAFYHSSPDDFDLYAVGPGYVGASAAACNGQDRDTAGIYASYRAGKHQIHGRYAALDCDADSAEDSIKLEYVHHFNPKAAVWLAYEQISSEGAVAEPAIAELGLRYDF